jgi:lipid A 3-O-deacylase PagL
VVPFFLALFVPQTFNLYFSAGENPSNRHGHSVFRSVQFEVAGTPNRGPRWLRNEKVGAEITYSAVVQARSWFGYTYGDPNDNVRAEWLYLFVRHERAWRFFDIGTGPMWSNRRIPAATSRLNFNSQVSVGLIAFANSRAPLRIGYRFSHISNGGLTGRNPGLNVNSVFVGVQARRLR